MSCEILSLISGKGGVGKTSVAVNMAHFLASAGLNVLLIDCDRYTSGATLFYSMMGKIPNKMNDTLVFQRLLQSVLDADVVSNIDKKEWSKKAVAIEDNLDFIPATEGDNAKVNELKLDKIAERQDFFFREMENWMGLYQVMILDHGAGENGLLSFLLHLSTAVMIVGAPNQLSEQSTNNIYRKAYGSNRRIVYCINKIPKGQSKELMNAISLQPAILRTVVGFEMDENIERRITTGQYLSTGLTYTGYRLKEICCTVLPVYTYEITDMMDRLEAEKKADEDEKERKRKEKWFKYFNRLHLFVILFSFIVMGLVALIVKDHKIMSSIIGFACAFAVSVICCLYYVYKKNALDLLLPYYRNLFSLTHQKDEDDEDTEENTIIHFEPNILFAKNIPSSKKNHAFASKIAEALYWAGYELSGKTVIMVDQDVLDKIGFDEYGTEEEDDIATDGGDTSEDNSRQLDNER